MQTVYARGGSQRKEVADWADVVFINTVEVNNSSRRVIDLDN